MWCGGRVLRGGDEDLGPPPSTRPSSLSGDLHPPRHQHSRAPASLVRPTLHGHWCSVWTDALPIIWLLVLASAPAIGLQQCTGGAQHNPDIATRSHAQDGYMLVFIPLLLERPNLNTVYLYSHVTCNVLLSLYILVLSTFFKIFRPIHHTKVQ